MDGENDYVSDEEGSLGSDDLTLPKGKYKASHSVFWSTVCIPGVLILATVTKMIQELLPADIACSKDSRDLLMECCVGRNPVNELSCE